MVAVSFTRIYVMNAVRSEAANTGNGNGIACSQDDKPDRVYFVVASNDFQAGFIARQLYRQVPTVKMQDPKSVPPRQDGKSLAQ